MRAIVSQERTPNEELRLFVAFASQPVVAAFLAFVSFPALEYTGRTLYGGRPADAMDAAVSVAAGVGIAALLVTILGALPLFGFLGRRGVVNRAQVLVSGALLGNVPSVVILALTIASGWRQGAPLNLTTLAYSPIGLLRAIVYGSFLGMASACAFWLLAPKRVD